MTTALPFITWLYVPAIRTELLPKALASGADVVIVDLEDAVLAGLKADARRHAHAFLDAIGPRSHTPRPAVHLRVNPPREPAGRTDLAELGAHPALDAVRLAKVDGPQDVDEAVALIASPSPPPFYALLESAAGVERALDIARHPAVAGIALGEADLAAELGVRGDDAFAWIRSRLVVASAAAGLAPPAMAVYTNVTDLEGLSASCARGRAIGMVGRTALHPRQLPVIREAFTPAPDEVTRALEVVTASERAERLGSGAIALPDGRFIDLPIVNAARRTLALARHLGVHA